MLLCWYMQVSALLLFRILVHPRRNPNGDYGPQVSPFVTQAKVSQAKNS
jgi:hypothetical protein